MMKFSKKQLALAVGTVLGAASLIPSAQAVNLATDGLGQVLIFPYYTVKNGWTTLFNITNTSNKVVAIKVRFHESYNSRDVFDFKVILSPHDVWNGWLSLPENNENLIQFTTEDRSCAVPEFIPGTPRPFQGTYNGNSYDGTIAYTGPAWDGGPGSLQPGGPPDPDGQAETLRRMQEGYVTVIMMGAAEATDTLAANAVHNTSTGIPKDCGKLSYAFADPNGFTALNTPGSGFPQYEGINPLKGFFSFVNAEKGQNASGSAVTLANFRDGERGPLIGSANGSYVTLQLPPNAINAPDDNTAFARSFHEPTLNSANTPGAVLREDGVLSTAPAAPSDNFYFGSNQVSWVLLRDTLVNHWTKRPPSPISWTTNSDWVVTFPTKAFFVDDPLARANPPQLATEWSAINPFRGGSRLAPPAPLLATSPFSQLFQIWNNTTPAKSCDPVAVEIFNREEKGGYTPIYSPGVIDNTLCYEANVLNFGAPTADVPNGILDSKPPLSRNVLALPGEYGWMRINLASSANTLDGRRVTTANPGFGLPVVGFSISTRSAAGTDLLNEAFLIDHSYTRRVPFAPAAPPQP